MNRRSRNILGIAIVMGLWAILVASDAWLDIWRMATGDEESSHILLVPVIVIWLFWVRRERLANWNTAGRWVGALIMIVGAVLWWQGNNRQILTFWHGGAVLMLVGTLVLAAGARLITDFAPALFAFAFMIPAQAIVRQNISVPLQNVTAQVTQIVCETIGMSVVQQGNVLIANGQQIAIAEACNGVRMIFALFLVAYAYAFITALYTHPRMVILLLSPVLAIVCNVIRLVPTVYIYSRGDIAAAEVFHDISGWVMLVVAYFMLLGSVSLLQWAMVPVAPFRQPATV
jgi:exosortase